MKKHLIRNIIIGIFIIVVAVFMVIMGFSTMGKQNQYTPVTAVISGIDYGMGDDSTTVFVTYTVDDHEYTRELGLYSSDMYEGKEIEIRYNPEEPAQIVSSSWLAVWLPIIFGIVAALAGVAFILKTIV